MSVFHPGELAVQAKTGTTQMAERIGRGISENAQLYAAFLEKINFVVAGSVDKEGYVWASPIVEKTGFVTLQASGTVFLKTATDSLLSQNLKVDDRLALLILDPLTRRRLRINGRAELDAEGIKLNTREVYGNCPKYIQKRAVQLVQAVAQPDVSEGDVLTPELKGWLESADTFFVASNNPKGNLDVSHRGGQPGFVKVQGSTVFFPDYQGNMMFNTLGNIQTNPQVGLVFINFVSGDIVQLRGPARILWDEASKRSFKGAERVVSLNVQGYRLVRNALSVNAEMLEFSPYNPG